MRKEQQLRSCVPPKFGTICLKISNLLNFLVKYMELVYKNRKINRCIDLLTVLFNYYNTSL